MISCKRNTNNNNNNKTIYKNYKKHLKKIESRILKKEVEIKMDQK